MYVWGIKWIKKYDEGKMCYAGLLIVFTALFYSLAVGMNIYGYMIFKDCSLWANIVTSVLLIFLPIIQIFGFNQQNSLLTTSLVCIYVSYLSLMGQFSLESCSSLTLEVMATDLAVSVILLFVTMCGSVMGGTKEQTR